MIYDDEKIFLNDIANNIRLERGRNIGVNIEKLEYLLVEAYKKEKSRYRISFDCDADKIIGVMLINLYLQKKDIEIEKNYTVSEIVKLYNIESIYFEEYMSNSYYLIGDEHCLCVYAKPFKFLVKYKYGFVYTELRGGLLESLSDCFDIPFYDIEEEKIMNIQDKVLSEYVKDNFFWISVVEKRLNNSVLSQEEIEEKLALTASGCIFKKIILEDYMSNYFIKESFDYIISQALDNLSSQTDYILRNEDYRNRDLVKDSINEDILLYVENSMRKIIREQCILYKYLTKEWVYASDYKVCRSKGNMLVSAKDVLNRYSYKVGDNIRIYSKEDLIFDFTISSLTNKIIFDTRLDEVKIGNIPMLFPTLIAREGDDVNSLKRIVSYETNHFKMKTKDLKSFKVLVNNEIIYEVSNEDIKLLERECYFN